MNNLVHAIDGFYTNDVYYTDTDSLYIENNHWEKLDKVGLVEKIDYKEKTSINRGVIGMVFFWLQK